MLPNFIVAGAPTSGTTSLHHYLGQHPQIYMSSIKEPTFFAAADILSRDDLRPTVERERAALRKYLDGPQLRPARHWVTEWDDYVKLFRNVREETAIGESSASYIWLPSAAPAIRAKLPGARLIFVLRDPVDRLFSSYVMSLERDAHVTFRDWVLKAINARDARAPGVNRHPVALDGGFYATHLQNFYDQFPRAQVRVYLHEAFRTDTPAVLRDMLAFLGVDPDYPIDVSRHHNETRVPRSPVLDGLRRRMFGNVSLTGWLPARTGRAVRWLYSRRRADFAMGAGDRRMVIDYYRDEILRAGDLIGRDLSAWLR